MFTQLRKYLLIVTMILCVNLLGGGISAQTFIPENIISDEEFLNANSMTLAEIQSFLESRNSGLKDQNLWQKYNFSYPENAYYYNYRLANGKYGRECSPAEIIYYSAKGSSESPNQINPKVLIALLQNKHSLIDDPGKVAQSALDVAVDYKPDDVMLKGFFNQVSSMASELIKDFNARQPGVQLPMHVNSNEGMMTITPHNRATAVLYKNNSNLKSHENYWRIYKSISTSQAPNTTSNRIAQNQYSPNYQYYFKDTLTLDIKTFTSQDSLKLELKTAADPFGTYVGSFNGVSAYSKGSTYFLSNQYNYYSGTNTGMKWQCVEFVQRYYLQIYGANINA